MDEKIVVNEPIEMDKAISENRPEPYTLSDGFTWDTLKLYDPPQLKKLHALLNGNVVEDDDEMFRIDDQLLAVGAAVAEWYCGVVGADYRGSDAVFGHTNGSVNLRCKVLGGGDTSGNPSAGCITDANYHCRYDTHLSRDIFFIK